MYPEYVEANGKRFKINTDFRVALECNRIAEDLSIGNYERMLGILCTLFGPDAIDNKDDYKELLRLAKKYLACGKELKTESKKDMDFVKDYGYIWASFMSDYSGLDLDKTEMHWWKFNDLLNGLSNSEVGNCCILNIIRNGRNFDPKKIKDPVERNKFIEWQNSIKLEDETPKKELTDEEKKNIEEFYKQLGL